MLIAVQVIVVSLLDPIGLTTLFVELGLGTALKYGGELPMSRDQEREADELGLEIMARACYDVRQATGFFSKMNRLEQSVRGRRCREKSSDWASTHPSHPKRIANVQQQMTSPEVTQHCESCRSRAAAAHMTAKASGWFSF